MFIYFAGNITNWCITFGKHFISFTNISASPVGGAGESEVKGKALLSKADGKSLGENDIS